MQLAEEYWGEGYCGSGEYQWPCLIITNIGLDASDTDSEPRDKDDSYRVCYDITVQTETAPWDTAQNIPNEPRTFIQTHEPFHQCADVSFFCGDETDASGWSFGSVGTDWWKGPTDALLDYL